MAWDDISDIWWLNPKGRPNQQPEAVAQQQEIARRRAKDLNELNPNSFQNQMMQQEQKNRNIRAGIDVAEYQYKTRVQNDIAMGLAEFAKTVGEIDDWSTPEAKSKVYGLVGKYPFLPSSPMWKGVERFFENADKYKSAEELANLKSETERFKVGARSDEMQRKFDIMQQRANIYGDRVGHQYELGLAAQAFREANAATTHEERKRKLDIAEGMFSIAQKKLDIFQQDVNRKIALSQATIRHLSGILPSTLRIAMESEERAAHDAFILEPAITGTGDEADQQREIRKLQYYDRINTIRKKYEVLGGTGGTGPKGGYGVIEKPTTPPPQQQQSPLIYNPDTGQIDESVPEF